MNSNKAINIIKLKRKWKRQLDDMYLGDTVKIQVEYKGIIIIPFEE